MNTDVKIKIVLFTTFLLIGGLWPAKAELTVAASGKPRCVIVQNAGATLPEQAAAKELADYLHQITGATFIIQEVTNSSQVPENAIIVGPGPVAQSLFPAIALDGLGMEEFVMCTQGHRLLLAGGRTRGTLYAVDRFLQEQCGVRWWTPWATDVPHHPTLHIPSLDRQEKPAFEYREPFWYAGIDPLWKVHNGVNGAMTQPIPTELGGGIVYKGFVHTSYALVPPDKYFATHPEWYSLINGKRTTDRAQLCLSNPELRDFVVDRVQKWLRKSPEASIVSVSQNDCGGACQCPDCRAIDEAEGSPAGSMITFVNYVAQHIQTNFPNVAVDTLAYQYTRHPPKNVRPLPNVIVRLCSIECNFRAPLDDPSNAKFLADLQGWSNICHRLYVWDYVTDFSDYLLPHPNWFALGPNLRLFHQYHVQGVFEEGAYQSNGAEMAELRNWLLAQLLWNPQQDDHALIQEFLDGYYGPAAAKPIRHYLDLMQKASQGYYLACYTGHHAPFLRFKVLARAELDWQAAEKAAAHDPEKLARVQAGHLAVQFAFLRDWAKLRDECTKQQATWPLPESSQVLAQQFAEVCKHIPGNNGTQPVIMNEGGLTSDQFLKQFAQEAP
jgi:hypothetical protein